MEVVAVVAQRSDVVRRYIEETGLPFNILIDQERRIHYSFVAEWQHEFPEHDDILAAVDRLRPAPSAP